MTLLATAKAFAYMMTELRIPAMITEVLLSVTSNKYVLMLIINILLLLLGCFMDMAPLITIMTPILLPVVTNPAIGMDPVHFGVVMIFNLAVGLCRSAARCLSAAPSVRLRSSAPARICCRFTP